MKNFPLTTAIFEGGLVAVAIALGWLLKSPPLVTFRFDPYAAALGIVATVPLLGLFWLCVRCPLRPFVKITKILDEAIVPLFRECRFVELAILATLAGLGEEMLFRGVVQTVASEQIGGLHGMWLGLVVSALLFGLLHLITPTYALLATLIGLYLGWLWLACGNLLAPVVTHGVYDFVALVYLVKVRAGARSTDDDSPTP